MEKNNEKEPKVIHVSSTVIIAAIIGLVMMVSMFTGTFPMLAFLMIGIAIGYFRPIKTTSQLSDIKDFLDSKDNYYTYTEVRTEMPEVKTKPECPDCVEPKEESKDDNK